MSDTIILYEMVPKWNRLYKQKGEFRQIRWCETHDCPPRHPGRCWTKIGLETVCVIVDKWLEV